MCGDGTNDVGALKHAHVGVALISNFTPPPTENASNDVTAAKSDESQKKSLNDSLGRRPTRAASNVSNKHRRFTQNSSNSVANITNGPNLNSSVQNRNQKLLSAQEQLRKMLKEEEELQIVKLGDASIAAPFTSKLSSIQCSMFIFGTSIS